MTDDREADRLRRLNLIKELAMTYWAEGDLTGALRAMLDQMKRFDDLPVSGSIAALGAVYAGQGDAANMKLWIEGFR